MTDTVLTATRAPAETASPGRVADQSAAFKNVLVGVDGLSTGRDAIALAETLRHRDGRLTLAHIVPAQTPADADFHSTEAGHQARDMLEHERAAAGVSADLTGMFAPSVGRGLHKLAADTGADLLVVGSSTPGALRRLLRGHDPRATPSGAPCAVAVAPLGYAECPKAIETIGVAYNGTPASETALAVACAVASSHGATVRTLTVVRGARAVARYRHPLVPRWRRRDEPPEPAHGSRACSCVYVDGRVAIGSPGKVLLAFGDQVDLLVVGSRGHGLLRRLLLGSTSAHLVHSARCPVLVPKRRSRRRSALAIERSAG